MLYRSHIFSNPACLFPLSHFSPKEQAAQLAPAQEDTVDMVCCPQCPLHTTAGHRLPAKGASCTFWDDDSPVIHREGFTALPANQGQEQISQRHWEHCLPCSWASTKHQVGNQSPAHIWRGLNTNIPGFVWLHGKTARVLFLAPGMSQNYTSKKRHIRKELCHLWKKSSLSSHTSSCWPMDLYQSALGAWAGASRFQRYCK